MRVRLSIPKAASTGEVIEIRAVAAHPMEPGFRRDAMGKVIQRDIITEVRCTFNGAEIFRADLFPAIAANPYLSFFTTAMQSGEFEMQWLDQHGNRTAAKSQIVVT
ncbi:MAG: thiosulfate oxidation carrier complex protein SoxZ [Burkholderiaceae bacterium]